MDIALTLKVELPSGSLHTEVKQLTNQELHPGKVYKSSEHANAIGGTKILKTIVPAYQVISMSQQAVNYFIGKEMPERYKGDAPWSILSIEHRLNWHMQDIANSLGGTKFTYSLIK